MLINSIPEAIGGLLAASVITLITILRRKNAKLKNLDFLGVDNVLIDRHEFEQFRSKLFSKSKEISIHKISIGLHRKEIVDLIKNAIEDGKSVKILISDPSSKYIDGNDTLQLGNMANEMPSKIKDDLKILAEINEQK